MIWACLQCRSLLWVNSSVIWACLQCSSLLWASYHVIVSSIFVRLKKFSIELTTESSADIPLNAPYQDGELVIWEHSDRYLAIQLTADVTIVWNRRSIIDILLSQEVRGQVCNNLCVWFNNQHVSRNLVIFCNTL